jgi:O-succinylbenzoate synthase
MVELRDNQGNTGWGEIAPLPGFHRETLRQTTENCQKILPNLLQKEIPLGVLRLKNDFQKLFTDFSVLPSVRYGIEQAILTTLAAAKNKYLFELWGASRDNVPVNALISSSVENLETEIKNVLKQGYGTLKLKVGNRVMASDVDRVKSVTDIADSRLKIRLDANRAWSLQQAITFARSVNRLNIEYIEEPLKDPSQLDRFNQETGMPVALDESLQHMTPDAFQPVAGVCAVVLKPSLLGGLENTARFCRRAGQLTIKPVISCAFYSGYSVSILGQFACASAPPDVAMGLDTLKWFKDDILQERIIVEQGMLNIPHLAEWTRLMREDLLFPLDRLSLKQKSPDDDIKQEK